MNLNPPGGNAPPGGPARPPHAAPGLPPALNLAGANPAAPQPPEAAAGNVRRQPGLPLPGRRPDRPVNLRIQEEPDGDRLAPLHRAILMNDPSAARAALRLGANPDLLLPDQTTPLMFAARQGAGDMVETLLNGRRLQRNARDSHGATALHHAASGGSVRVIGLLVEAGIDRFAVRANGYTALHVAASGGHADAVVALMNAMPGYWNHVEETGLTPLLLAALMGHADVVAAMAAQPGFDVNHVIPEAGTALHIAAGLGSVQVVNVILGAPGVDVNAQAANHPSPLQIAAEAGHDDIVEALVGAPGIDVNIMQDGVNAPLHLAVAHNQAGVLQRLLAAPGIDVNLPDRTGNSALMMCCLATPDNSLNVEAAMHLLNHPGTDPNGGVLLLSRSEVVRQHFRQRAGVPDSVSDRDFEMQELERWTHFVPASGKPNRLASSMTNFKLGMLLHETRSERAPAPPGARRDLNLRDAAFRLTLALEQVRQFADGHTALASDYAGWLLAVAPPEPAADAAPPYHYRDQFLIGGIDYPRSEIEDMAQMRGNYAMHDAINAVGQPGGQANVHHPGFLLRGRDVLMRLQERDLDNMPLGDVVTALTGCINARATDAMANQRVQAALHDAEQAQGRQASPEAARLAVASWIAEQPEQERAALEIAWRVRLMHMGLQQTLSQDGAVDEGGLMITAPETLRLLHAYIVSQLLQPGRRVVALQLQDAVLERLADIGAESPVCNTGCVQRLLDAPAGIDATLMAREPHDRAIYHEILQIGASVHRAFEAQYPDIAQNIASPADQQTYDDNAHHVCKDILSATTIDDLVRRRGWHRPRVEAQLQVVLDDLDRARV